MCVCVCVCVCSSVWLHTHLHDYNCNKTFQCTKGSSSPNCSSNVNNFTQSSKLIFFFFSSSVFWSMLLWFSLHCIQATNDAYLIIILWVTIISDISLKIVFAMRRPNLEWKLTHKTYQCLQVYIHRLFLCCYLAR